MLRFYAAVAIRGFRRHATYRAAAIAGLFTNTVFGFLLGYVRLAVYESRPDVNGFDAVDVLTYTWIVQGLQIAVSAFRWEEVAIRVKSGDIALDLARPYNLQLYWLAHDYGRAAFQSIARGVPPFLVGAAVFHLRLPTRPAAAAAFMVSLFLAVTVAYALWFLINCTTFWIGDLRGIMPLYFAVAAFLGGFLVPVAFFPDALADVARVLPFVSLVQTPVDVFLEQPAGGLGRVIGLQVVWAVALLGAGQAVLARASRRVVIQGG